MNIAQMKILFLCGSLEPGRDGVGDYCRRLATELSLSGHTTALIALNDGYIENKQDSCFRYSDYTAVAQLRLPAIWSEEIRFKNAKTWIELFNPNWISLQFVAFSFHPKGLPLWLSRNLEKLRGTWHWHIMFHEIWVGINKTNSIKYWFWGSLQKKLIRHLISKLKPSLIHTHTRLYQSQLNELKVDTRYLPIFGNIPVTQSKSFNQLADDQTNSDQVIRLVIFGSVHNSTLVGEFSDEILAYSREFKRKIELIIVGISGPEQKQWEIEFKSRDLKIESLGEQSAEVISSILAKSTVGISTVPFAFAEKSGTIAAMREHGLPVLCVSMPWKAPVKPSFDLPQGIIQYQKGVLREILQNPTKYPPTSDIKLIATELAGLLTEINDVITYQ